MDENKVSVTDIIDRMKTVLGVQQDKQASELLGGSKSFISVIKNRGTIPFTECLTLAIEKGARLDWLILGRGESGLEGVEGGPVAVQAPYLVELPFFDAGAAVWGDALADQAWSVPAQWLELQRLGAGQAIVVRVAGDAMSPLLAEDEIVLVNLEQRAIDGVYLVRFGAGVHFRRIQHMADGSLRLSCDNPAYAADVVPAADRDRLQIIGHCHSLVRSVQ
jgi:hypothetical protein